MIPKTWHRSSKRNRIYNKFLENMRQVRLLAVQRHWGHCNVCIIDEMNAWRRRVPTYHADLIHICMRQHPTLAQWDATMVSWIRTEIFTRHWTIRQRAQANGDTISYMGSMKRAGERLRRRTCKLRSSVRHLTEDKAGLINVFTELADLHSKRIHRFV